MTLAPAVRLVVRNTLPRTWNRIFCALLAALLLVPSAHCFTSDPETVDLSPALQFDDYTVSQYLVDKNYNLFLATAKEPPSTEEKAEWFARFIAEQALIAELRQQGWREHPEVALAVDSMERYMLLQDDGPLLTSLVPLIAVSPKSVGSIRERAKLVATGSFIKVDPNPVLAGTVPENLESLEQLLSSTSATDTALLDVSLNWPFNPFMAIRDEIAEAEIGDLHGPFCEQGLLLYFQLSSRESTGTLYDNKPHAFLAEYAAQIDRAVELERFKKKLQEQSKLTVSAATIVPLSNKLAMDGEGKVLLREQQLATAELFQYTVEGTRASVSVAEFLNRFNHYIQRPTIDTPQALHGSIETYVLSSQLLFLAQQHGVVDSPRFSQNRLNYENNCIIEAYKSANLKSEPPSEEEIQQGFMRYYGRAEQPTIIAGELLIYDSWQRAISSDRPIRTIPIEISENSQPIADNWPNSMLLRLAEGMSVGPAPTTEGVGVFKMMKILESRPLTLSEVRRDLLRNLNDARFAAEVLTRLKERLNRVNFRCLLDFSRYGIQALDAVGLPYQL